MGGVSSAEKMPGGTSTGTVEQSSTATRSDSTSTDAKLEVTCMPKPLVAHEPAII